MMTIDAMTVAVRNKDKTMTMTSDELESNTLMSLSFWQDADLFAAWFAVNTSEYRSHVSVAVILYDTTFK